MKVAKNDGEYICRTVTELLMTIRNSSQMPYDDIWISREAEYPCLAILLNGNLACVHYFLNENGDMWQSAGVYNQDTEFVAGGVKTEIPANAVIGIEEALACAEQFWFSVERPTCVEWREL